MAITVPQGRQLRQLLLRKKSDCNCLSNPDGKMAKGLYRQSDESVMVLYEKNSMFLPKSDYEERGYKPVFDNLPTHAEWVAWHRANGSEGQTHAEWVAWREAHREGSQGER
ncbi:hypothetical protein DBIPINDM_002943 [Mesorhizobium sp. AR02]|uniref:hypothetical protein n=1 Tax=Mesorhizobium sp. AR02 TaxID=2865837 RepID=UPI00215EA3DD|nr:hypothetical protein [Mesorhizobium sp. AR02]UVK56346.1 hypothetical protein DBIPINDM_002943 [Mesorhizobium sp. AR02]